MLPCRDNSMPLMADRRWKPLSPHCPRCDSSNTKFCYYNNYSLSQPRYFCKGCRRYWTMGGSLRNVPVGGGCRKNRRGKPVSLSGVADPSEFNYSHQQQSGQSSSNPPINAPVAAAADGSAIDLAALYAKFSDQCPRFEPGFVVPELPTDVDSVSGSSESNSGHQLPIQLLVNYHEFGECQGLLAEPIGEDFLSQVNQQLNFSADPSGMFDSLPSPVEFVNNFSSDLSSVADFMSEANMYQSLDPVPVESMVFHHNLPVSYWSTLD